MPSFGGTLSDRMSKERVLPRAFFPGLLASAALGLLLCAVVMGGSSYGGEQPAELVAPSPGNLGEMQREVQEQLVEAAKRRASASRHKAEAVALQAKSEDDSEQALLLRKQAELAHKEAQLKRSASALSKARLSVKALREKASELDATADKDLARADKDKEQILELEDEAGTYSEKAGEESDKIKLVQAAETKTAQGLPKLLSHAETAEKEAAALKAAAAARMKASSEKSSQASHLDEVAREKEQQAKLMRERLMAVLQQKAHTLEAKQEQAAKEEQSSEAAAAQAARRAEALAGHAEEQAALAQSAEEVASERLPSERAAQMIIGSKRSALRAAAQAKASGGAAAQAAVESDRDRKEHLAEVPHEQQQAAQRSKPEQQQQPQQGQEQERAPSREEIDARRAANLQHAGAHAAKLRAMRSTVASDGGEAATGIEDEDGHLQLQGTRHAQLMEDGHYSEREEAFKKALAAAYRTGYSSASGGASALATEKPARMQMLGDTEMLQKGPGEQVALEAQGGGGSAFPMLWEDDSSLGSETRRLAHSTEWLRRAAPREERGGRQGPDLARLYEDGHTSREEQAFQKDMVSYRGALREERSAALAKAQRATQELSQLPSGGSVGRLEERRHEDLHAQMHRAQNVMLSDPRDHWEVPARHGGDVYVREDEDGHLVLEHGGGGRDDELRGEDEEGDRRGEALSSARGSKLRRIEEELEASRRRDRRLEARTERLQGEVDALSARGAVGRMQDLSDMERRGVMGRREEDPRREGERFEGRRGEVRGEEGRREERRGPRRVEEGRREERGRRHVEGGRNEAQGDENFSPDATYEKMYAGDPGHVSVAEIKFQHALKSFDRTKDILRQGAIEDDQHMRLPELVPSHLPGQGL